MNIILLRKKLSFQFLNLIQFLGALNDNIFKLLIVYLLIALQGSNQSSVILAITGSVFVLPFLLFSMPGGILADKMSKSKVILITKICELLIMVMGLIMLYFRIEWGLYLTLFLMASQSAIFGPAKYGIIPELVRLNFIAKANAILSSFTFLAIIFGTFFASYILEITHRNYVIAGCATVIFSILGLLLSLLLRKTKIVGQGKSVHWLFIIDVYRSLKIAKQEYHLPSIIFLAAFFWYLGAFTQLNIIPFVMDSLKLTDIYGGYLFVCTALGIGIGSFLTGFFSGKNIEIGIAVVGLFGLASMLIVVALAHTHLIVMIIMFALLGFFGGMFIVPLDAYIQFQSPEENRGFIIASANFLSFFGIFLASITILIFKNGFSLLPFQGFFIVGMIAFIIWIIMIRYHYPYLFRYSLGLFFRCYYRILPSKDMEYHLYSAKIFISSKYNRKKILSLITISPNVAFIRVLQNNDISTFKTWLSKLIEIEYIEAHQLISRITEWREKGRPVCILGNHVEKYLKGLTYIHMAFKTGKKNSFFKRRSIFISSEKQS